MARGKSPKYNHLSTELVIDAPIHGKVRPGRTFTCINLLCPNCSTVAGSQMDPTATKNETFSQLIKQLRPTGWIFCLFRTGFLAPGAALCAFRKRCTRFKSDSRLVRAL